LSVVNPLPRKKEPKMGLLDGPCTAPDPYYAGIATKESIPSTYRERLEREAKHLQFRLDRINRALQILAANPDIEELLTILQ
jgi:hypothetical protein